jgi:hypothetical protein
MPIIAIATRQDTWWETISEAAVEGDVQDTLHIDRLFVTSAVSCYQVERLKSELLQMCMDVTLASHPEISFAPKSQSCC